MRVEVGGEALVHARHLAVAGLGRVAFRGIGHLRPGLGHPVLAVVFLDPVPGVGLDGLAAPHDRAVGAGLDDEVPAAADPGLAGQDRRLVLGDAADLRQLLVMRLERLGLAALAFRNSPGMRRAGAHIVRIALDHRRRVGDGGVARLAGLRRPVTRQGPGLGGPGLVAGGEGFREPHARGRNPAGGLAGVGHHRPVAGHRHRRAPGRSRCSGRYRHGPRCGSAGPPGSRTGGCRSRCWRATGCPSCSHGRRTTRRPGRRRAPRSRARSPSTIHRRVRRPGTAPTSRDSPTSPRRRTPPPGCRPGRPARCRCRRPASPPPPTCARRLRPWRSDATPRRADPSSAAI